MSKEKQNLEEKLIDPSKAPFELLKEGEKAVEYSQVYLSSLEENWPAVCELMEWEKLPWESFLQAKDPFLVVSSIQEKLKAEGGDLGKHEVDGRFGANTLSALHQIMAKRRSEKVIKQAEDEVVKTPKNKPTGASIIEFGEQIREKPGSILEFMKTQKFSEIMKAVEKADVRLKEAGLKVSSREAENFTIAQREDYKERAEAFRVALVEEEPRLKPLVEIAEELIVFIETEIKGIDFSKINNINDLRPLMESFLQKLEGKMDGDSERSKEMEELVKSLDLEILMALLTSVMNEVKVSTANYVKGHKEEIENFSKNLLLDRGDGSFGRLSQEERVGKRPEEQKLIQSGKVKFWHKGRRFVVNLDKGKMRRGLKKLFKGEEIRGCRLVGDDFVEIETDSGVRSFTRDELVKMK